MILKTRESGSIEFLFDWEADETPHLMGSWNGWRFPGIPMVEEEGRAHRWKAAVHLAPGEHQFRYRVGDRWFNDPAADRYVDNGRGSDNSVVIVEEVPKKTARVATTRAAARPPARTPVKRPPKS